MLMCSPFYKNSGNVFVTSVIPNYPKKSQLERESSRKASGEMPNPDTQTPATTSPRASTSSPPTITPEANTTPTPQEPTSESKANEPPAPSSTPATTTPTPASVPAVAALKKEASNKNVGILYNNGLSF